jgi:photosystem I subunit 3
MKKLFLIFSLGFLFLNSFTTTAFADVAGLVDCNKSSIYTKKLNSSITKLETRLKKYEAGSPPSLALQKQIENTKQRFDRYAKSGLVCGNDGLPHLIVDGRWDHAAEFTIPGIMFIYIAGWIGWVGRKYLRTVSSQDDSTQKEIIIDVPVALSIMTSGFSWPFSAWQEFTSGDLLANNEDITVSPR